MNKTRVMLDIETLGKRPGSVIVSIGAVKFGAGDLDPFYKRVDPRTCAREGLQMDAETVLWWMEQGEAAREELCRPGTPIRRVLQEFSEWIGELEVELWGNGASFDPVLLGAAYDAVGMERPWKFQNERCYRTMKALYPEVEIQRGDGTRHNALDDAVAQARHLLAILERMPNAEL